MLLTIWGTPAWANGGARPNVAPADPRDAARLRARARRPLLGPPSRLSVRPLLHRLERAERASSSSRRSSTTPVGLSRRSSTRALVAAAYAGIKSASPQALVAAGETAARGRDEPRRTCRTPSRPPASRGSSRPAAPDLRFDAWAHHPYPRNDLTHPDAPQRWPAVGLTSLGRFDASLARWFGRSRLPLWVTEIAYRTSPEIRGAAPYSLQAALRWRARSRSRGPSRACAMLVWFVFRDEPGEPWQSGLLDRHGRAEAGAREVRRRLGARRARPRGDGRPDELRPRVPRAGARAAFAPARRARGSASATALESRAARASPAG